MSAWQGLAQDLCRIFLGWKLREDYDALLAIGEGALHLDLRNAEAWCDGDPLPPLFIAGELRSEVEKCAAGSPDGDALELATLDAEFQTRSQWRPEGEIPVLEIACRVRLRVAGRDVEAEAGNQGSEPASD